MKKIIRNDFVNDCVESLRSLSARFELKLVGSKCDTWSSVVEFANDTIGVIVRYERRDNLVQTELAELKDGEIVPMPLIIHGESLLSTLPLGDVLVALGASDEACQFGSSKSTIRDRIDRQVGALEAHATSVLEGDFPSFDAASKRLKSRLNARRGPLLANDKEELLAKFPQLRKFL